MVVTFPGNALDNVSRPDVGPMVTYEDRVAAALLESAVELSHAADIPASVLAPYLESELKSAYGLETTAPLPIILRALQAWKPRSTVNAISGLLRLSATGCPLAEAAVLDPGLCRACSTVQRELLARGISVDRGAVEFPHTIARGDATCEVRIHLSRVKGVH